MKLADSEVRRGEIARAAQRLAAKLNLGLMIEADEWTREKAESVFRSAGVSREVATLLSEILSLGMMVVVCERLGDNQP